MNKQQLASKIWSAANNMRSKIEANEYKDYILGFIFYKFLSEKEEQFFLDDGGSKEEMADALSGEDEEYTNYLRERNGYFIEYKDLFSTWLADKDFDVSDVSEALSAFERNIHPDFKKVYGKIFDTLASGLSKLGDSSGSQTKAIRELLKLIKDIPMDDKQGYDVLGFIYEYLISMFAANAGKKAGEFYTPHEVSMLMAEIVAHNLSDNGGAIRIYDPTSGSGSLLINIGKAVSKYLGEDGKDRIEYYAQELKENTYSLTRMNLVMRGILPQNIKVRNGDTLADDWPYFEDENRESYTPLFVDAVVSNPPYSQKWDSADMESDVRFKDFGLAPQSKADYAFLLHDLYHINDRGIVTIVLPHGVLFRGGEEEKIRRNLIEKNNIEAIIGLPANIFFGTGIPTLVMVLKKRKESSDVLIIDASKGFEKVGKSNRLRSCDIKKIVDTYISKESIPGYSKLVTREEIRDNGYNLNIPRYVDSSEKPESWDVYSNVFGGIPNSEVDALEEYWDAFPSLKEELFAGINGHCVSLKAEDIEAAIRDNGYVKAYKEKFAKAFCDFHDYLKGRLIDKLDSVDLAKEESIISGDIFARLEGMPLADRYDAYQMLDDEWAKISVDLEIIGTEGREAITKVDPNMVMKKDQEVQDGFVGRVLPFELIQKELLSSDLLEIEQRRKRLEDIASERSALFEEVGEDDREDDCIDNEEGDFIDKEIASRAKEIKKARYSESTPMDKIVVKVNDLITETKALNKEVKALDKALLERTKATIENLSEEEALVLLEHKWVDPIVDAINGLPDLVLKKLTTSVKALSKKYDDTLINLNEQISSVEKELSAMLDDLEADEYDSKGLEELKKLLGGGF